MLCYSSFYFLLSLELLSSNVNEITVTGKSTVLHALAGKIKENSKVYLEGNRYINGGPLTGDSMVPSAFVEQEVTFFPHSKRNSMTTLKTA